MNYLIHKDSQQLIINTPDPGRILTRIPTAKLAKHKGQSLVVVPHQIAEVQQLKDIDIEVASPIGYYYDFPRDKVSIPEPYKHQLITSAFMTLNKRCYILNDIGTGKTMSALWAADYLIKTKQIRKVLIVSPMSTLEQVWSNSIYFNMQHRKGVVLHGTADKRKRLFADDQYDFYVINIDALDIISKLTYRETKSKLSPLDSDDTATTEVKLIGADWLRDDIDLIIIDESSFFRNGRADRTEILTNAIKPHHWVWAMTATPTPNAPSDAWAQCHMVTPKTVPKFFTAFRNLTMQKMSEYVWVPRKEAPKVVFECMQPAIRFVRDECIDLPPCTYSYRTVEMSPEQKKHFKEMEVNLKTELAKGLVVSAFNEGIKASKLIQIACGVVYDKKGDPQVIKSENRLKVLQEIIESTEHKVIVFVPFTAPLMLLKEKVSKYTTCEIIYGEVSKNARTKIFNDFQNKTDPRVLIADAGCMSHGLTLTEANIIVWYGPEQSNDTYVQANGRITRPGQVNSQHIIHIASSNYEMKAYKRNESRSEMQHLVLDMIKRGESLL